MNNLSIIAKLKSVCSKNSKNVAIIEKEMKISYSDLSNRIENICRLIYAQNVVNGSVVAIVMERGADMIATLFSVWALGNVPIMIDVDYPEERIHYMIDSSEAVLIITDGRKYGFLNEKSNVISVHEKVESLSEFELINRKEDDDAYIIFTSGSTGEPKGIVWSYRNIFTYLEACYEYYNISKQDVVLQQTSCSFDTFMEEVLPVLLVGGTLVVRKRYEISTIDRIEKTLLETGVTIFTASPILINELNKCLDFHKLRLVISGGDILRYSHINNLIERKVRVVNSYGPAECTICASVHDCHAGEREISIGKAWKNYNIYVVDENMKPVSNGVVGEIVIGGPAVGKGYLNKKHEKNRFVFSELEDGIVYKTGDMAIMKSCGELEFRGRVDNQLKINGYRIEIEEVEKAMLEEFALSDVLVRGEKDETGKLILCAYYVAESFVHSSEFLDKLKKRLLVQMIPNKFFRVSEFATTDNGMKKDRNESLEDKIISCGNKVDNYAMDKLGKKIIEMWAEITECKVEEVDPNMSFVELGGHSLNVMQLLAEIEEIFDIEIDYENMYSLLNLKSICNIVREQINKKNSTH